MEDNGKENKGKTLKVWKVLTIEDEELEKRENCMQIQKVYYMYEGLVILRG